MLHALTLDRLEKALSARGCPACTEMDRSTRRYLRGLLRDHKANAAVWGRLERTWGLCQRHTAGLLAEELETMAGFSAATLYGWLAGTLLERADWNATGKSPIGVGRLPRLLKAEGMCLACEQLDEHQRTVVQDLARTVGAGGPPGIREAYLRGDGLCLPHLRLALEGVSDPDVVQMLSGRFLERLREIAVELDRYREACAEAERPPQEPDPPVWRRAIEQFAGKL